MRQYRRITILLLVLALVIGCAANTTTKVTKVYTATAATINAVHDAIDNACNSGLISAASCTTIKADYNKAATAYKASGDVLMQINIANDQLAAAKTALAAANTTANASAVTTLQNSYNALSTQYGPMLQTASDLITAIINTLTALGVNVNL